MFKNEYNKDLDCTPKFGHSPEESFQPQETKTTSSWLKDLRFVKIKEKQTYETTTKIHQPV